MIKLRRNEPLSRHTTFRIGGPAKYFCEAGTKEELKEALSFARKKKLKTLVLGSGSNILVSDDGFSGMVIAFKGGAGVPLPKFLNYCAKKGFSGLEFLAGVPGSVGGAVYMNAGAYGKAIGDVVTRVYAVDHKGKESSFSRRQCRFGYRSSVFQGKKLVITGVEFDLRKRKSGEIKKEMKGIIGKRWSKQPYEYPSAGSVFKNPKGGYAAELIEGAGCKGMRAGGAEVSRKHANFMVNRGKATASDVKELISLVQKKVKEKYGIKLEPEVLMR